jgi:hypothetical protein
LNIYFEDIKTDPDGVLLKTISFLTPKNKDAIKTVANRVESEDKSKSDAIESIKKEYLDMILGAI